MEKKKKSLYLYLKELINHKAFLQGRKQLTWEWIIGHPEGRDPRREMKKAQEERQQDSKTELCLSYVFP